MLLQDKTAIVYGAAGLVGAAVAGAFAREGARVVLAGRTQQTLARVADQIRDAGGAAQTAVVDVTDTAAMRAHAAEAAAASGGIDIAFNAISNDDFQGIPLLDMDLSDFARPVSKAIAAHFTIATVTARHMLGGGGVILAMGGGREAIPCSAAPTSPGPRWPGCAGNWRLSSGLAESGSPGCFPPDHPTRGLPRLAMATRSPAARLSAVVPAIRRSPTPRCSPPRIGPPL
jgi:NAD(P)-dependent dehydrogenase (short-subunit alcohol dehydrogenase family)